MAGYLSIVLNAHLPFVRHPEHEKSLEENWLFEAITETYLPLLQNLACWEKDGIKSGLTLALTPTLCSMLEDPFLQARYQRHLDGLIALAEKEIQRTAWEPSHHSLALFYHEGFRRARADWEASGRNLIPAFRRYQDLGQVEIITSAATHAVLPLLTHHPPSVRAQILAGCDHYQRCFGRAPRGIWLPECAYAEEVETVLAEAGLRWFVLEAHGLLHAEPRPRYGMFAPIITPKGLAAFGRDLESAKQVWSRQEGYPGDPRYREFYRDIGFDLEWDYVKPHLPGTDRRVFTGIKYHRVTGSTEAKEPYDRPAAVAAAQQHADHFVAARSAQMRQLSGILDRPPLIVSPYDAELFGHWWFEGPEFLDRVVRQAASSQPEITLITPGDYLARNPTCQAAAPGASSWGEEGYWGVWLNEDTQWIYPHLQAAQERMTELARRFVEPDPLHARALRQAARELLLAQASDWPFLIHTHTSPDYGRKRLLDHLQRFSTLFAQLTDSAIDEPALAQLEAADNLFPQIDYRYWA